MKKKLLDIFHRYNSYLGDSSIDVNKRLYLALSTAALAGLFLAFIGGIIIHENLSSLIFTVIGFLFFLSVVSWGFLYNKTSASSIIVSVILVCGFLPVTFFTSGGIFGGTPIWCIFVTIYIEMILVGKLRLVFFALEALVVCICWGIQYFYPEIIIPHSDVAALNDSLGSLLIVSIITSVLINFQAALYKRENKQVLEQKKQIEELNESQNRFFSTMSHEIRTPINTIIGFNEMILRENVSAEINEDADNIKAASSMLLHLINDILDVSKLESGKMNLDVRAYSMGEMLSDIVGMFWLMAQEKDLDFKVDIAGDVPSQLMGDDIRIQQILINIINNAIKYTHEGSVVLSVAVSNQREKDIDVVFTVSDTGIGIRKESIPYLFDAFSRINDDGNRFIEGTGLGLSIVKQFVDLMYGHISVNSVYTKGSTFVITIPQTIVNDSPLEDITIEKRHNPERRTIYTHSFEAPQARILVVDDTESNLLVVKKLLKPTRVQITLAKSGAAALKKTLDISYDVIFMDHMMPQMDGVECAHKIQTQIGGMSRNAAIVALTANAGSNQEAFYKKEGFDGYLVKPVDGATLEKELVRLLPGNLVSMIGSNEKLVHESLFQKEVHRKKAPVVITTESVADLPASLAENHSIRIIPYKIITERGVFRDNEQIQTMGVIAYLRANHHAYAEAPNVNDYEKFFADSLDVASHVIHLTLSSKISYTGANAAMEAARSFDNVSVIDSENVSGGLGFLAVEAARLARDGADASTIEQKIIDMRNDFCASFICGKADLVAQFFSVSRTLIKIANAFLMHPEVKIKNGRVALHRIWMGSEQSATKNFIRSSLSHRSMIDKSMAIIVHSGLDADVVEWIKSEVLKKVKFEKIYTIAASPSIVVNSGPDSFGLIYKKSNH